MAVDLICDVCGEPAIGVASSAFGAVSFAFCVTCLNKPAEPLMMFHFLFEDVSTNGDGLKDEVNQWFTWRDGQYISWPDFRVEQRAAKGL